MTSSRSPWRQSLSCSQLWIGNRIRSAVASPSPVSPAAGVPGGGGSGGASQLAQAGWKAPGCGGAAASGASGSGGSGAAAANCPAGSGGGGGEASTRVSPVGGAACATGSMCSTGPSVEPRVRSSGRSTATRVTGSPLSSVEDEPAFSNTHWLAPSRTTACCRETNGTSVMRSLSGERPIRAVSPGRTVKSFPSRDSRTSPTAAPPPTTPAAGTAGPGTAAPGATAAPPAGPQKFHPAGASGQDGSGRQPGSGRHPAGGAGQPGGGLKAEPAASDGGLEAGPKASITAPFVVNRTSQDNVTAPGPLTEAGIGRYPARGFRPAPGAARAGARHHRHRRR